MQANDYEVANLLEWLIEDLVEVDDDTITNPRFVAEQLIIELELHGYDIVKYGSKSNREKE